MSKEGIRVGLTVGIDVGRNVGLKVGLEVVRGAGLTVQVAIGSRVVVRGAWVTGEAAARYWLPCRTRSRNFANRARLEASWRSSRSLASICAVEAIVSWFPLGAFEAGLVTSFGSSITIPLSNLYASKEWN